MFEEAIHVDRVRVRVLGSALRIECERASLSAEAQRLLHQLDNSLGADGEWQTLSIQGSGLTVHRFARAMHELENRQLLFSDSPPLRVVARRDSSSRMRLERLILQLKNRQGVERTKLGAMVGYATALMCRRKFILDYFGDQSADVSCGRCDACAPAK